MELPKPRTDNMISHSNRIGNEAKPLGAGKHKVAKSHLWRPSKPRSSKPVSFSMTGPCSGDLADVLALGMRIAREAMEAGDKDYAARVIKRLKRVPKEYELLDLRRKVERLQRKIAK